MEWYIGQILYSMDIIFLELIYGLGGIQPNIDIIQSNKIILGVKPISVLIRYNQKQFNIQKIKPDNISILIQPYDMRKYRLYGTLIGFHLY